jgi:hypothetical protein
VGLASAGCSEARPIEDSAPHARDVADDPAPAAADGSGSAAVPGEDVLRDAGRAINDAGIVADAGGSSGSAVAACLADLFAACPLTGACHESRDDDAGVVSAKCFASGGTSTTTSQNDHCTGGRFVTFATEVRSADGALCFTAASEVDCTQALEAGKTTWKDRHGNIVAVLSFDFQRQTLSCSQSGQTQTCRKPCSLAGQSTSCEQETCP